MCRRAVSTNPRATVRHPLRRPRDPTDRAPRLHESTPRLPLQLPAADAAVQRATYIALQPGSPIDPRHALPIAAPYQPAASRQQTAAPQHRSTADRPPASHEPRPGERTAPRPRPRPRPRPPSPAGMGNSQSSSDGKPNATSPTSPTVARHVARRKHSAHALAHAHQKPGAPSILSTTSSAVTAAQPTRAYAHATVAQSPASSHSRARSITTGGTPRLKPEDSSVSQQSDSSIMGSESSRHQRPPSRTSTLPASHTLASHGPSPDDRPSPSPSTRPVDVPQSAGYSEKEGGQFYPSGHPDSGSPYGLPPSNFSRPPRLPLPIEEVHGPGSPIITPQDISSPIGQADINGLPRRASVLSSTTVDDEDMGDNEAFTADQASLAPSVPMEIEWKGPGEKVYVTGTFVQWDRKFKLHRDKKGGFSTTLQLKPGTHHLKFLVDGDMTTSHELPTTVDYTNILVNYIEVVAPLPESTEKEAPAPAEPMPIPGAAATQGQVSGTAEAEAQTIPVREGKQAPETEAGGISAAINEANKQTSTSASQTPQARTPAGETPKAEQDQQKEQQKPPRQPLPTATYTNQIPQFLLDLDTYNTPNDERFQRSSRVVNTLPQPPSLPMFLGKSILNGNTPHKDDASVLIMPNHTVLNHLATSSIKNGVLATSGTTRYKRKVSTSRTPRAAPATYMF